MVAVSGGRQGERAGPGAPSASPGRVSSDQHANRGLDGFRDPCPGPGGTASSSPSVTSTKDPRLPGSSPDPATHLPSLTGGPPAPTPSFLNLSLWGDRDLSLPPRSPSAAQAPSPVLGWHGPRPSLTTPAPPPHSLQTGQTLPVLGLTPARHPGGWSRLPSVPSSGAGCFLRPDAP